MKLQIGANYKDYCIYCDVKVALMRGTYTWLQSITVTHTENSCSADAFSFVTGCCCLKPKRKRFLMVSSTVSNAAYRTQQQPYLLTAPLLPCHKKTTDRFTTLRPIQRYLTAPQYKRCKRNQLYLSTVFLHKRAFSVVQKLNIVPLLLRSGLFNYMGIQNALRGPLKRSLAIFIRNT